MVINSVPLRQLACPYIQEGFCVPLRKTSPIYTGKILRALRKIPPIYIGGILRTPTQNLSYIYRRDFAYPYAKPLLYIKSIIYIYIGGILRTPTQNLSYIYRKDFACPTQNLRRDFVYRLYRYVRFTGNTWSEVLTHGPGSNKV